MKGIQNKSRLIPANCEVLNINNYSFGVLLKSVTWFQFLPLYISELLSNISNFKKSAKHLFQKSLNAAIYKLSFDKLIRDHQDIQLFYSYWADNWLVGLLKSKKNNIKIITRAHNYDLYDERSSIGFQPYRKFVLKNINGFYPISQLGAQYTLKKDSNAPIKTFYLGINPPLRLPIAQPNKAKLTIVSCAYIVPIKRIHLLVETLFHIREPIKWIHIGDGPLFDDIRNQAKALPKNVECDFLGSMTNDEVHQFYVKDNFDVFISVSQLEGIPVSVMEAISYGCYVIATDAGATKEALSTNFSKLLPVDFNPKLLAKEISEIIKLKTEERIKIKESARAFYQEKFLASKNYNLFIQEIQRLI
jgi:colanic acid/amylovoran biosynthesis glycosyltransferase